jgi:hypothetical protein
MVAQASAVKLTPEQKRAQTGVIQAYNDFWNQSMWCLAQGNMHAAGNSTVFVNEVHHQQPLSCVWPNPPTVQFSSGKDGASRHSSGAKVLLA